MTKHPKNKAERRQLKRRNPVASELKDDKYHQRVIDDKRRREDKTWENEAYNNDE